VNVVLGIEFGDRIGEVGMTPLKFAAGLLPSRRKPGEICAQSAILTAI
jgi:hypothetical protein